MSILNKLFNGITSNKSHFEQAYLGYITSVLNQCDKSELDEFPDGLVAREFYISKESPLYEINELVGKINFLEFLERLSVLSFCADNKEVYEGLRSNLVSQYTRFKSRNQQVALSTREFQNSLNSISKYLELLRKENNDLAFGRIYNQNMNYEGNVSSVFKSYVQLSSYYALVGVFSSGENEQIVHRFIKTEISNFANGKLHNEKTIMALFDYHRKKLLMPSEELDYLYSVQTTQSIAIDFEAGFVDFLLLPLIYNGDNYDDALYKVTKLKNILSKNDKDWNSTLPLTAIFGDIYGENHLEVFKYSTPALFNLFFNKS